MSKVSLTKLREISSAANKLIGWLADDSEKYSQLTYECLSSELNDKAAPPAVVKAMADELINLRETNQRLQQQRIADRRRFSNPAPESLLTLFRTEKEDCTRCNADGWRADEMGMTTCSCSRGKAAHEEDTRRAKRNR